MKRIAIIGAGPIGLEAALAARDRGHGVEVFERGQVADAVSRWGHVRMFSPFRMNTSAGGVARLESSGASLPAPEELLTGAEFRGRYLVPLAQSLGPEILHENTAVLAIGRSRVLKGDHIGEPARGTTPFRLLVRRSDRERIVTTDAVLDCSGNFAQPNRLGDGGIPAPGEQVCADRIHYGIPDLSGAARARFAGRRVLVVGAGHSAATVVCNLAGLNSGTETHWLVRRELDLPAEEILDDPLPERARLATEANRWVREKRIHFHRAATIEEIERTADGLRIVLAERNGTAATLAVDEIIATTGYRPDMTLARELQVQTCWATEGTYPLAASLLGEAGADCLKTAAFGAEMLMHPEPGYFTLGMKSYGRSPNFLLRTGHEQIERVLDWMDRKESSASMRASTSAKGKEAA